MRGAARVALVLAASATPVALGAPVPADFEKCVEQHPGEAGKAAREACFARLLGAVPPDPAPPPGVVEAAPVAAAPGLAFTRPSQFARQWGSASERASLRAGEYHLNYFLPVFHASNPNLAPYPVGGVPGAPDTERQATEAKFQLSLKGHVWPVDERGAHDLWIGYTQVSHWQIWNEEGSRPFRESSYEPELIYTWEPTDWKAGEWRIGHVGLSLNHNSNGGGGDKSRSWNRVIAFARAEKGDTMLTLRAWSRIREGGIDDNPEIEDYYGRADLQVSHQWAGGAVLQATGRHSLRGGDRSRGALQLDLSVPICGESWPKWLCIDNLRAHAQYFRGYAESLIDYNHLDTYYGVGFSLGSWR